MNQKREKALTLNRIIDHLEAIKSAVNEIERLDKYYGDLDENFKELDKETHIADRLIDLVSDDLNKVYADWQHNEKYIKLYAVDYFGGGEETDTTEIFLTEDKAREFIKGLASFFRYELFTADFNRELVFIDENELNYDDRADLIDWNTKKTIESNINTF